MKLNRIALNLACAALAVVTAGILIFGLVKKPAIFNKDYSDGIEQIDLDTIYLKKSGVHVNFSEVLLSNQHETRKLIVSEQSATVSTQLTDRVIKILDAAWLTKTQQVSYTGKGYFVVDLDRLKQGNILDDPEARTVTIRIDHAYLQAIEIDPNRIQIDAVKEGLFARGDIQLTVQDYNSIEKELRSRLEEKFNTAENGQQADALALKMVQEIYEPVVKAIDGRYSVKVEFA